MTPRTVKDDSLLLLTAAIWGFAFVAQRAGMEHIQPFTYNGVRFALGSLSLIPLIFLLRHRSSRMGGSPRLRLGRSAKYGLLCGSVLFTAASLQQVGIVYTTAGKAGFITGMYVVLVPLSGLLWKQRAGWSRWVGAGLALVGLYLLSITRDFAIARGDFLVLLSALFWTAHVQLIGLFSPKTDSLVLASIQFGVCSLFSLAVAAVAETVVLEGILRAAIPILYGGLCSVGIAYTLQVVIQKTAHPAHAAIILSLEGAFAVLGGWLILGEVLSLRGLLGCALMLAGMILSQTSTLRNPAAVTPQP
ncbi:MAG: DMT family transporter [Spirochaetaceae bacterium]|nr:MAG: DMT family transporter [Spirochaetaceae bacterium]